LLGDDQEFLFPLEQLHVHDVDPVFQEESLEGQFEWISVWVWAGRWLPLAVRTRVVSGALVVAFRAVVVCARGVVSVCAAAIVSVCARGVVSVCAAAIVSVAARGVVSVCAAIVSVCAAIVSVCAAIVSVCAAAIVSVASVVARVRIVRTRAVTGVVVRGVAVVIDVEIVAIFRAGALVAAGTIIVIGCRAERAIVLGWKLAAARASHEAARRK
jgi:hypothetical protein